MPPLRPLPDLCLITLFKMMPPNDQMVGSQMSPRCAGLVRAANRTVKTLVITDRNVEDQCDLKDLKDRINSYSLASKPAMQQLMDIPGEPSFPDYPLTTRLSKWHCLVVDLKVQIDTATIEQIVNNFSAVTDLKSIAPLSKNFKLLVALLQHSNWKCRLTNLMVDGDAWFYCQEVPDLFTAINGLTALQCLALDLGREPDLPDLPILAQLKVVGLRSYNPEDFLLSLEQYAADNDDLQVHLISDDTETLLSLNQPLHSRILCIYGKEYPHLISQSNALLLCSQFFSLTSLSIDCPQLAKVVPLFTALSQLHQLVHLRLCVGSWFPEELLPPAHRPLAQLNTVRVLQLSLTIYSHSVVQWLNFPVTMPNLYTIYIEEFYCRGCCVNIDRDFTENPFFFNFSETLSCLQFSLFTLHCGVPMNRLILDSIDKCLSAEDLLLQSASEPSTIEQY